MTAFRLSWFSQDPVFLEDLWNNIISLRTNLDARVQEIGGICTVVSAITGTISGVHKAGQQRRVYPGVAYWIVIKDSAFSERMLFNHMNTNKAGATMKLLLQPYQQDEKHLCNALCAALKDNIDGCVRRLVNRASEVKPDPEGAEVQHPIMKVFVVNNPAEMDRFQQAQVDFRSVRFHMSLGAWESLE